MEDLGKVSKVKEFRERDQHVRVCPGLSVLKVLRSKKPLACWQGGVGRDLFQEKEPWGGSLGQILKEDIPGVFKKRLPLSGNFGSLATLGGKRVILRIIKGTSGGPKGIPRSH